MFEIFGDILTLYKREMMIFKSHIKTNIARSIIFPLMIILVFGNLNSTSSNVGVAVVNYANNQQSMSFINSLSSGRAISVQEVTTQDDALTLLANSNVNAVIVILPTFPSTSSGNPSVVVYYSNFNSQATAAILPLIQSDAQKFGTATSNQNYPAQQKQPATTSIIPLYGTSSSYKIFLVGGVIAMVAAFGTIFGGGMSIITDRELGYLKSFLIAPINKNAIVISKIFSGVTQSFLYIIIALLIGIMDGATIAMGWIGILWIIALGLLISFGFAGITTVLASRITRIEIYTITANIIVMPLWFLSGAFFPTSSLPSFMVPFSVYNPMTYATQGIRDVMIIGYYPISQMVMDVSVLIGFLTFGIIASILLFKNYID
ncbi:MAG: ABC transporter permease [Candidatus Marsarchaeota archaeon]|jgi:ABC-2 type transport system permease protein|nr:ABC transporter permease [Candidatus Marsarchaeota archaeon]